MDKGRRKLLYLARSQREAALPDELGDAGWDVRAVDSGSEARRLVSSLQFHVGLARFDEPGDWEILDGRSLHGGASMQWIALVSPASMRLAGVSRGIRANFFDYHTLPADSRRLLAAMGHAYGMATLASGLLLTPAQAAKHRPLPSLHKARRAAEHEAIERALRKTQNNITKAARELGISRVTLYRLIEKSRAGGNG